LRALENFSVAVGRKYPNKSGSEERCFPSSPFGGLTGSAQLLLWAHAEYVKLHRSAADGKVFDLIEAAHDRYVRSNSQRRPIEVWKLNEVWVRST